MIRRNFRVISILFGLLLICSYGNCVEIPGLKKSELRKALEYAVCSVFYWHGGAADLSNNVDLHYSGLFNAIGKSIPVNLYCDLDGKFKDKWFCAEFPNIHQDQTLTLDEKIMGNRILFSSYCENSCSKIGGMRLAVKNLEVNVPKNWRERILSLRVRLIGSERNKMEAALRKIFLLGTSDSLVAEKIDNNNKQHFFVGPYTPLDCGMYVYWVELKKYWYLPISPVVFEFEGEQDYNLASPYTLWKPVDVSYDDGNDPSARRWRGQTDQVIANCVRDGDLFELVP
jgi:hypothetical protein